MGPRPLSRCRRRIRAGGLGLVPASRPPAGYFEWARCRWRDLLLIRAEAARQAALFWAFGTLIGNTDLHNGNLSFVTDHGRPYELAPAYDMTPMGFAPRSGGGLPDALPAASLHAAVANESWRDAAQLAGEFLARVRAERRFSQRFAPCIAALKNHLLVAGEKIQRLG